ncbi:prolyl aminopeptidase [Rhodovibrio salinarum]|uniref:Proline iminopeptidase n=1 Tax=Rhodovibrio salinarum TaxID=1087 RepID=A0A934QH97_9PROT|nr:prolyl aminopeptidase [Rhodovibrio salinarum]MBK1696768.1 prolyl aminopeptidase [Rhodovibrio salinarum]
MTRPQRDLFPSVHTQDQGQLPLDDRHTMYWETAGKPDGQPALFLHGGPGAGASADHRRFFDPEHYYTVLFDQRGAGRSTPLGETRDNTTQHLIQDIETLRQHLGIERWLLFGGSWGSTLALAYAQAHPERVTGLVLRGIFLGRRSEIRWFLTGMGAFCPEAWDRFASYIPEAERGDLLRAYCTRLDDPDPEIHVSAARAWSTYEGSCSTLLPSPETVAAFGDARTALGLARLEAHYFAHNAFLEEGQLLRDAGRLHGIPGTIVQGRYDVICPPQSAWELKQAWPQAQHVIVPDAGHSAMEPGIRRALVAATQRMEGVK